MTGRLRTLTLVDRLSPSGGAERLAMRLAIGLDPDRFERTLCITRWPPSDQPAAQVEAAVDEVARAGVRLLTLERSGPGDVRAWRPLLSALRDEPVDVLHAHKFGSNLWGAVFGRRAGVPVVIAHEHTWSFRGQPVRRLLDRQVVGRLADVVITVSREDRRRMIELEGMDPKKLVYLPNGLPPGRPPSGRDVRAELGIGPDDPVVGCVTRLRPQKAPEVLVRTAALLAPRFARLRVLVAGEGPERPRLEALIEELGLGGVVTLLGLRDDVPDLLAAVDVAVSSSAWEGSPLAVMEYMEAARPVVATRVGGLPELIEDGVHGVLVAPGDPRALADATATLLEDPARAAAMGRRARERRRSEFGLDTMVHRLERLYVDLHRARTSRAQPSLAPA